MWNKTNVWIAQKRLKPFKPCKQIEIQTNINVVIDIYVDLFDMHLITIYWYFPVYYLIYMFNMN